MKQWLQYESTNDYIGKEYGLHDLRVFYNKEDYAVVFMAKGQPAFTRDEAIDILKNILETLERIE